VSQRHIRCDGREILRWRPEKRTAGRRQPDAFGVADLVALQALKDRVVLAVDGQQPDVSRPGGGDHEFAGGHQSFLVGQGNVLAGQDRAIGRHQAGHAHHGRNNQCGVRRGRHGDGALRTRQDIGQRAGRGALAESGGQQRPGVFVLNGDTPRPEFRDLVRQALRIASGGQAGDEKPVRLGAQDVQRAPADGTGGSEDGDAFLIRM